MDEAGDLLDLSTTKCRETGANATGDAERNHAVADAELPGPVTHALKKIDFVAREAGDSLVLRGHSCSRTRLMDARVARRPSLA